MSPRMEGRLGIYHSSSGRSVLSRHSCLGLYEIEVEILDVFHNWSEYTSLSAPARYSRIQNRLRKFRAG